MTIQQTRYVDPAILAQRLRRQRITDSSVETLIRSKILKPEAQDVPFSQIQAHQVLPSLIRGENSQVDLALYYAQEAVSAFDAQTVSGKLTVADQRERIERLGVKTLEELGVTPHLKAEEIALSEFKLRVIQRLNGGRVTPKIFFECLKSLVPHAQKSGARVALHGGSFSPYTLGHNRLSQSAVLDAKEKLNTEINGVLVLAGGTPPEKDFVLADEHREAMVAQGLTDNPYLHYSPIRIQMAELFKDTSLGGKTQEEERRLRDLAAFAWIISMNPHLQIEYFVTGADKVNGYGVSGKNEKELVWDTLISHGVKLLTYNRKDEKVTLFQREEKYCRSLSYRFHSFLNKIFRGVAINSWVLDNRSEIEGSIVVVRETAAFNTSATDVRRMASSHDPILYDHVPQRIADYIYKHGLEHAFALENEHDALCKEYSKAGILTRKNNYTERLRRINEQRRPLLEQGILAHARDCSFVRRK